MTNDIFFRESTQFKSFQDITIVSSVGFHSVTQSFQCVIEYHGNHIDTRERKNETRDVNTRRKQKLRLFSVGRNRKRSNTVLFSLFAVSS